MILPNYGVKLLQDLRDSIKRPEYVLILTYSFDPRFFEETMVPIIKRDSPSCKIIVLTDEAEYMKTIKKTSIAGRDYYLLPVPTKGVFHPKMIHIVSKKKTTLYIGSMNMTATGVLTNIESVYKINLTFNDNSMSWILSEVSQFIKALNERNTFIHHLEILKKTTRELVNAIQVIAPPKRKTDEVSFVHNMEEPLINKILKLLKFDPSEISIMGPFYGDFSFVEELRRRFPRATIHIYLQNRRFVGTPEKSKHLKNTQIFDVKNERYLHAKVLAFSTEKETLLYLGSANPTKAAFLQTTEEGGNLETGVVISIPRKDFEKFMRTVGETERITPKGLRAREKYPPDNSPSGSLGVAEFNDGVLRVIIRTNQEIESVIISTGNKRINIEEFNIERKKDFIVITIKDPIPLKTRETAFIEINNQLTVPIIMEKDEKQQRFEHIEDQIISNTVFDYALRSQLEWILTNLEFPRDATKLKSPSIRIPSISFPKSLQSYKRLSTIEILRSIIRKLHQTRKEIPHDISQGNYDLARSKIERFLYLLLEAYPYFSPQVKREVLRRIKGVDVNIENASIHIIGNQFKFLKWQFRVENCEILHPKKELEEVFELDEDCMTIKIKHKSRFKDLLYNHYSEKYDKLTNQEMKLILYNIFKKANSFLNIVQLLPHLHGEEADEFKMNVNIKILTLHFLTSILDKGFSRHHTKSPILQQAYKELLKMYSDIEIGRRISAEATEVIEKLNDGLGNNFIQTPNVEDVLTLLQDIQRLSRKIGTSSLLW